MDRSRIMFKCTSIWMPRTPKRRTRGIYSVSLDCSECTDSFSNLPNLAIG